MAETRRKFDKDLREGAVRLVRETSKPIAEVARDLGIHDGPWGTGACHGRGEVAWVAGKRTGSNPSTAPRAYSANPGEPRSSRDPATAIAGMRDRAGRQSWDA